MKHIRFIILSLFHFYIAGTFVTAIAQTKDGGISQQMLQ